MDAMSIKTGIARDKASKSGLLMSRWVARVSVEEVVWIWRGDRGLFGQLSGPRV